MAILAEESYCLTVTNRYAVGNARPNRWSGEKNKSMLSVSERGPATEEREAGQRQTRLPDNELQTQPHHVTPCQI